MFKSNNNTGSSGSGYNRNTQKVEARLAETHVNLGQKQTTQVVNETAPDIFDDQKQIKAPEIDATDLSSQQIHKPTVKPVAAFDANKQADVKPVDPQHVRQDQTNAKAAYMEMDKQVKAEFMAELDNVDPEVGKAVGGMMGAMEKSSPFMLAVSLADDVVAPGASTLWAAIDAIVGDANNPNSDRVKEAISQTIDNLRTKTTEQAELASKGKAPAPLVNWNNLAEGESGIEQMKQYLLTPPEDHKFMRELDKNEHAIAQMEENFDLYNEITAKGKSRIVTAGMIENALEAGDEGRLTALVGDKNKVETVKKGAFITAAESREDALMHTDMSFTRGMKPKKEDISDLNDSAKEVLAKLANEPKLNQLVPNFEMSLTA